MFGLLLHGSRIFCSCSPTRPASPNDLRSFRFPRFLVAARRIASATTLRTKVSRKLKSCCHEDREDYSASPFFCFQCRSSPDRSTGMADLSIPPNKKKDLLLSLKTTKIITSRLSRPAVYIATRRTFAAHDIHFCTAAGARTRAQHACTSDFAIFSRAMGSFCLAWLPTMYRKYQKNP